MPTNFSDISDSWQDYVTSWSELGRLHGSRPARGSRAARQIEAEGERVGLQLTFGNTLDLAQQLGLVADDAADFYRLALEKRRLLTAMSLARTIAEGAGRAYHLIDSRQPIDELKRRAVNDILHGLAAHARMARPANSPGVPGSVAIDNEALVVDNAHLATIFRSDDWPKNPHRIGKGRPNTTQLLETDLNLEMGTLPRGAYNSLSAVAHSEYHGVTFVTSRVLNDPEILRGFFAQHTLYILSVYGIFAATLAYWCGWDYSDCSRKWDAAMTLSRDEHMRHAKAAGLILPPRAGEGT